MLLGGIIFIAALILLTDILDTIGQLILKSSINKIDSPVHGLRHVFQFIVSIVKNPRVWLGFLLSALSLVVWLYVLTKAELGFAFSLDSMRYILIAAASALFLKERFTTGRWMGIACVVVGIILVAVGGKH